MKSYFHETYPRTNAIRNGFLQLRLYFVTSIYIQPRHINGILDSDIEIEFVNIATIIDVQHIGSRTVFVVLKCFPSFKT